MKKTLNFIISFFILVSLNIDNSIAQISNGGTPYSIMFHVDNNYSNIELEAPDMITIYEEDALEASINPDKPRRMGTSVTVNKDLLSTGSWITIPDIGRICKLKINIENALALGVYYDKFYIPEGGELFLYNHDKTQIIGAFTHENNPDENLFSTEFIQGDEVILEYFEPTTVSDPAIINISEIAYAYRDIEFMYNRERSSWWCMIDVACEEGDNWENQIKGVARMSIKIGGNYYWCSGSLINNTNNDRTPYFLSAAHCGEGSNAGDRNQWIFYFNYQASTCNGSGSSYNSTTGCQLRAHDPSFADAGSDFYLVEFNNSVPASFDVFFNGWNRTNSPEDAGSGVGVHHPAGDIKKISTYDTPLVPSTYWNGLPSHWKLLWAQTINGKSIMQGGSSGSPIFDSNGLIMGDLTGGYTSNSCTDPSPAYYGKIWYSWDQNGSTQSNRLKEWLDPANTGIEKLPGISWEVILPTADYEASSTEITQGDTVFFTDLSGPGILEWEWSFEDGDPSTSIEENPYVVYSDTGYFDVSLTVVNADGTDSELKENYIHVSQMDIPVPDFEADATSISPGGTVHFTDLSTGNPSEWTWLFEGGSPSSSVNQNPTIRYNNTGTYPVTLIAGNLGGSDTIVKEDYIHVGVVDTEEPKSDNDFIVYPNPGDGHFTISFGTDIQPQSVEILNDAGNIVFKRKIRSNNKTVIINIDSQPSGLYLVKIYNGNKTFTKKISIVK